MASAQTILDETDVDFVLQGLDVGGAAPLGDFAFAVLDYRGKRVVVFDTAGRRIREFGQPGGGPGELLFPQMLVPMLGGRLGVLDGHKSAVVVFSTMGEPVAQYGLDSLIGVPASRITGLREVAEGSWVVSEYVYGPGERYERLTRRSHGVSTPLDSTPAGPMRPTIYPCNVVDEAGHPPVFWPTLRWDARAGVVASASSAQYAIALRDTARRSYVDSTPPRRAVRSEALLERIGGTVRAGGSECTLSREAALEQRSMSDVIPAIRALRVSPRGDVWVQRDGAPGQIRPIDVIDRQGRRLATHSGVAMPLFFLADSVFVAMDSTSEGYVALRTWRVKGSH